jgi:PAS domain S-box-containing protein
MANIKLKTKDQGEHEIALTLYQAFRRSNDVMFYCDQNGTIVDVNDAFIRHYGWSREEVIGQNPRILRSRYTTPDTYKEMWAQILNPDIGFWRGELVNRSKDGREIPVVLTITGVRDESGSVVGYVSNATDVGDLRRLQERLAQTEALAQLGRMAAVVAHEIRNPLGSIVLAARQLAGGGLPADDQELVLKILRDESQRLNETLTNFLSYARSRPLHRP